MLTWKLRKTLRPSIERAKRRFKDFTTKPNEHAIYVLGNQKAGTTAIAALLAECTGLDYSHDPLFQRQFTLVDLLDAPLPKIIRRASSSFCQGVIKVPNLTFVSSNLIEAFPSARFVFVSRDPRDNIRSMLNRLKIPGDLQDADREAIKQMGLTSRGWLNVFDGRILGSPYSHYIDVLAHRWRCAAQNLHRNRDRLHLVRYEDFRLNKQQEIEELADALGEPVRQDIGQSIDKEFQSRGDNSQSWLDYFGDSNLNRILNICRSDMEILNYPT